MSFLNRVQNLVAGARNPMPPLDPDAATGTELISGLLSGIEENPKWQDETAFATMRDMRRVSIVKMILKAVKIPIIRAMASIEPVSDAPEDLKRAEFLDEQLLKNRQMPWNWLIKSILFYLDFGVVHLVKKFKMEDNQLQWRKWQYILPETVVKYNLDKNGELDNIKQEFAFNPVTQKYENNTIEVENLYWLAHDKEGDNYRGESLLRSAYQSWLMREGLIRKQGIQAQRASTGIPEIEITNDKKKADALAYGEALQVSEKAAAVKTDDFKVGIFGGKDMYGFDLIPYTKYHDAQIANIVFAHFVLQGTEKVGSRAMQGDNIDFFREGLEAYVQDIVNMFNLGDGRMSHNPQLLENNFPGNFDCPKLKIAGLKQADIRGMSAVFKVLVDSKAIEPREGDENYWRELGGYREFDLEDGDEPVVAGLVEPTNGIEEEAKDFIESEEELEE